MLSGPEAYPWLKVLNTPGNHDISRVWKDDLAFKVHAILGVDWSSTKIIRIGYADEPFGNVILWIGIWRPNPKCGSIPLSYNVAIDVALKCKKLLEQYGIMDIDVEVQLDCASPLAKHQMP